MATIDQIKELREATGISISECKKALEEAEGNSEKARELLKKWGKEVAEKKQAREVGEGVVASYLHSTGKLGALVDVRCETDFVARSPEFKVLCHELALQVASMNPQNTEEFLSQPYVKDPSYQVRDLVNTYIARLGENIVVKQFSRLEI
ncbi:MAG: elongation factor T [Parcubacteria group bacterium Greene0714_21]|nr:MAG: elongation factor T [Parcubacteria group bacterium Greene0416_39]TSC97956.1 MAG: elongation factor T [Parcubacteria group bacterium Greene1014_47]TSD04527.1 MAG: elongation factor T [Parcubacteria group bacterium Greene0714_21]